MKRLAFFFLFLINCLMASSQTVIHNPLLHTDVPDPDVICVGSDYYMVSTTAHMSPGAPIMHSRDMKHWKIVSYVFDELHESPANDLESGNIYSRGQWAACIRHNKGKYYVFFGTGNKSYLYETDNPKDRWTLRLTLDEYYHDASMLFDDDGRIYLVYNGGTLKIKEFEPDLSGFKPDGVSQDLLSLNDGCLLEGAHIYKINGMYYIMMIWWPAGGERTQLCFRSSSITGPYEHRTIMDDNLMYPSHGVAQGGIWQAHNGHWYAMLFQDHEGVGRIPCLMECEWIDGWPILGEEGNETPTDFVIPGIKERGKNELVCSDDFSSETLRLNWQWNHNPDNSLWSLSERKGFLRLKTGNIVSDLFEARNTITQRTEGPRCEGTVKIDITNMKPGDVTGLFAFCSEPGGISVERTEGGYRLRMMDRGKEKAAQVITDKTIWLRMRCDFTTDIARFYYSTDGKRFRLLGKNFHMIFSMAHFTGNKFAIFNYSTRNAGGFVDIDEFIYRNE